MFHLVEVWKRKCCGGKNHLTRCGSKVCEGAPVSSRELYLNHVPTYRVFFLELNCNHLPGSQEPG